MTQIITVSLSKEAAEIVERLHFRKENVSEVICGLLVKYGNSK